MAIPSREESNDRNASTIARIWRRVNASATEARRWTRLCHRDRPPHAAHYKRYQQRTKKTKAHRVSRFSLQRSLAMTWGRLSFSAYIRIRMWGSGQKVRPRGVSGWRQRCPRTALHAGASAKAAAARSPPRRRGLVVEIDAPDRNQILLIDASGLDHTPVAPAVVRARIRRTDRPRPLEPRDGDRAHRDLRRSHKREGR